MIGEKIHDIAIKDYFGESFIYPQENDQFTKDLLIIFSDTSCGSCEKLMPSFSTILKSEKNDTALLVVSHGNASPKHQEYATRIRNSGGYYAIADHLFEDLKIGNLPYALLVSKGGYVISKGVINHLEHLESLLNARDYTLEMLEYQYIAEHENGHGGKSSDRRVRRENKQENFTASF